MPNGLVKGFPENHLQTMVLSGAKGATVRLSLNFSHTVVDPKC